jgi:Uma2 family endonuclease
MSTTLRTMTADELLCMPEDGYRYELIEGELQRFDLNGAMHGMICSRVASRLACHVHKAELGTVVGLSGFHIARDPDTVRAPDASFVTKEQIARCGLTKGYFPEAPALAVEVVSPGDTAEEVDSKVRSWLSAGTQMVWVVYPRGRTVTVYRSLDDIHVLTEKDQLTGEPVVRGFACAVSDLFSSIK